MSTKTISIALSLFLSSVTLTANSDNMAQSLMKLRAEVETLDTQIDDAKDAYKASMKSLSMQKSELEATLSRNTLKIKQLQKELSSVKQAIAKASKNSQTLKPLVLKAIDTLTLYIKSSIPFKTPERIEAIQTVKSQLQSALITPQKALSFIYNAYADEIRMSKENAIFKQTIQLNGSAKLVEVARLGTAMMFFKTPNDAVGYVTKDGATWSYKEELHKEKKEEILNIFDAFKKQIRTGFFTLPNALVLREAK